MSFADEVASALKPTVRCKTCQVLAELDDREEIQAYILANPGHARRISLALKARGQSVGENSVRDHSRDRHELL